MLIRINAAAVIDAVGTHIAPASMLLRADSLRAEDEAAELSRTTKAQLPPDTVHARLSLQAVASPQEIDAHLASLGTQTDRVIEKPEAILIPALVNAHAHLDLTHIGPQPFDPSQGFIGYIKLVLANRLSEREAIQASIARGAMLSLRGGVAAVGDIAGVVAGEPSEYPVRALFSTPLHGVSFIEYFKLEDPDNATLGAVAAVRAGLTDLMQPQRRVRVGYQPHALYSANTSHYELARAQPSRHPASTHLAETPEEHELIAHGRGPFRDFLQRAGWWSRAAELGFSRGLSPVGYFAERCDNWREDKPFLLAHVNDCSDADLRLLAAAPHSIAYCPRSSSYFRNHEHFGPHRYRDMLAAGINVCLGTDSVINLPDAEGISTLDEARFLFDRDKFDARELLGMATVRGARALGLPEEAFAFRSSRAERNAGSRRNAALAGVVAVSCDADARGRNPWEALMRSRAAPELMALHSGALWSGVS